MSRMKFLCKQFWFLALMIVGSSVSKAADQPNILWIVSEDNGPYLGCYGDPVART
ncbi:MAG: N-sulfoglucosamine sulfohydrolase, partial [Limisphaerales bacterium]